MMRKVAIERLERRKEHQEKKDILHNIIRCKRCGRILTQKYSQDRKLGYKCWKQLQHDKNNNNIIWPNREVAFKTAYELLGEELKDKAIANETLVKPFNKDELFQHE